MAATKPLLVLVVLAAGGLASTWRQTKRQLGKTFFHRPPLWAVFGTEALSRTRINLDPCRCLLGAGGQS